MTYNVEYILISIIENEGQHPNASSNQTHCPKIGQESSSCPERKGQDNQENAEGIKVRGKPRIRIRLKAGGSLGEG